MSAANLLFRIDGVIEERLRILTKRSNISTLKGLELFIIDEWDVNFFNEDRSVSFEGAGEMRESEVL
jgi:hypothetical protein